MFWKLLTLVIIILFMVWRVRRFLQLQRRLARGEEPVDLEPKRIRPISLLAGGLLAGYGGYLLWVLLRPVLGGS